MGEVGAHNWGACTPGQNNKTIGPKKYCLDKLIGARKTNSVMVMIIIHIGYITCLVTNDAWHAYDVIKDYKILHGAEDIIFGGTGNTVVGWYGNGRGRGP